MNQYIKVKAFAELTGVSVRTLQYYDEINLLKPAYINEYGHRFYDSDSFSKMFVILSLKNMGMNLNEIHQYVNGENFDIQVFVEEEKRRIETAIIDLQLRFMRLSKLSEQMAESQETTPFILPLFSNMVYTRGISGVQIEKFVRNTDQKKSFNIKEWNNFIKDLNDCFEKKLNATDKKAEKCILYWKEQVLHANQVDKEMIKFAEDFYQHNNENTYGITEDTYKYLVKLIDEYDSILSVDKDNIKR